MLLRGAGEEAEVPCRGLVDEAVCQLIRPVDIPCGKCVVWDTLCRHCSHLAHRLDAHKVVKRIDQDVNIEAHTILCGEVGEQEPGRKENHIGQPDATPQDPATLIDHLHSSRLKDVEDDEAKDRHDEGDSDTALPDQRTKRRPDEEKDDHSDRVGILSPKLKVVFPDQALRLLLVHIIEVVGADVCIELLRGCVVYRL